MADNFFDKKDIIEDDNFFDEADLVSDELDLPEQEPEEMGAAEAALTGFGQGASFGLSPIVSGLMGAGIETAEDVADVLGLTTESELEEKGFDVPDDYEGLQGLVDAYYAARNAQKAQEEKAFEDRPLTTLAGNIAGGVISGGAATKAPAALGKILPKAQSVKGLSAAQKAGIAAREGGKAGLLAGFGAGEARLGEGEVLDTLQETAATGLGGAAVGTGLSLGGTGLKKGAELIAETPLAKNIKLGYDAALRGLNISDDKQITDFVRNTTADIRKQISQRFKGASKKALLEQADEIGIRVSAGEKIDDVINDIKETGAFGVKEQKELNRFVEDLRNLNLYDDVARDKLKKKLEQQAAVKLNKAERQGKMFRRREEFEDALEDIGEGVEQEGSVLGIEDIVDRPYEQPTKILTQGVLKDQEVPLKQYDLDALKLSELDEIISKVGTRAYQGADDASVPYAKDLYAGLRKLSNDAMEDSSLPEKNKKLKALFDGLESLGIKPKDFFSKRETIQDAVEDTIQQKLTASPLSSSDNKMQNFLKYLRRADEQLADRIEGESKFASDISKFVRQSEGEGSVSLKAAAGPVQKIFAKLGNVVGAGVQSSKEMGKGAIEKLKSLTPEDVRILSSELSSQFGEKAAPYVNQLSKAVNAPGQRKTALLYGIYQQPAFREMLERAGRVVLGEESEEEETIQQSKSPEEQFFQEEEEDQVDVGRYPQGMEDVQDEDVIRDLIQNEGDATFHKRTSPYEGLTGPKNTRVEGSSDQGLYYDSEGKLTAGYGDLVTTPEEAQEKMQQSPEQAREELIKNFKIAQQDALKLLEDKGIDPDSLSVAQLSAIVEMVFQLGVGGASQFNKTFNYMRQGEYDKAAQEAQDSLWYKQTPYRVKKFQDKIRQAK
jgi:lysozyme